MKCLMKVYYHYTVCLGMTSFGFDAATGEIKSTRTRRILAMTANVMTLLLIPFGLWDATKMTEGHDYNPLILTTHLIRSVVLLAVITYTVVYRYKREKLCFRLALKLIRLDKAYLTRLPKNERTVKGFSQLLYLKYILLMYLAISSMMVFLTSYRKWSTWYDYLLTFCFCHINNIVLMTEFNYTYTLWFISTNYSYLNMHLETLLKQFEALTEYRARNPCSNTLQKLTTLLCRDLERLMRVHWKLSQGARQLNKVYGLQMLGVRLNNFIFIVILGYYGTVFTVRGEVGWLWVVYGPANYFAIILDMYLSDLLCDMAVRSYTETVCALRLFNCHELWNNRLKNAVEYFSLSLSSNKLCLVYCGLFEVNKQSFFGLLTTVASYTITLVQFHMVQTKGAF